MSRLLVGFPYHGFLKVVSTSGNSCWVWVWVRDFFLSSILPLLPTEAARRPTLPWGQVTLRWEMGPSSHSPVFYCVKASCLCWFVTGREKTQNTLCLLWLCRRQNPTFRLSWRDDLAEDASKTSAHTVGKLFARTWFWYALYGTGVWNWEKVRVTFWLDLKVSIRSHQNFWVLRVDKAK